MPRRLLVLPLLALALSACGGDDDTAPTADAPRPAKLSVALDFTPNPVHAPLFTAERLGLDARNRLDMKIVQPGAQPDALKAVVSGRADVGLLDIVDLALAVEKGVKVQAFAALVQQPLAALIAREDVRRPKDLEGRTVGVSGLPSDPAFLAAIVRDDGGDPEKVKQVEIGFEGVSALLTGKVAAVPAFRNVEGVVLERRGFATRTFAVEDFGAPPFPEVVLFARTDVLAEKAEAIERLTQTLDASLAAVRKDPAAASEQIADVLGDADRGLVRAQLDALAPGVGPTVALDTGRVRAWAGWAQRVGLLGGPLDVARAFRLPR